MRSAILLMTLCCLMGMTAAGCKSTMEGLESDIRTVLKKMEMDRFQDTTAEHKQSRPGVDSYSLNIQPVPEDSSIAIVDLDEKYYPGMKLEPGEYEIIVQHAGYEDFREWINLENNITLDVILNKEGAAVAVKKPTYPARKTLPGAAAPEVKSAQVQAEAKLRPGSVPAVLSGHKELVTSLSFGPDGRLLASGSYDNTVILWNMPEGSRLRTLTHDDRLRAVAFSPDGKALATGGNAKNVFLWDVETGALINTFRGL